MKVFEIMTKPCITITPNLGVEYVARLFANTKTRRAPVVENGLKGIISISDILKKSNFVEQHGQLFLDDRIDAARADARAICEAKGKTAPECACLLYTSPSPRDLSTSRMPSSA